MLVDFERLLQAVQKVGEAARAKSGAMRLMLDTPDAAQRAHLYRLHLAEVDAVHALVALMQLVERRQIPVEALTDDLRSSGPTSSRSAGKLLAVPLPASDSAAADRLAAGRSAVDRVVQGARRHPSCGQSSSYREGAWR